jgi:hypothetical protein
MQPVTHAPTADGHPPSLHTSACDIKAKVQGCKLSLALDSRGHRVLEKAIAILP